jgi:hypothetical protein
MLAGGIDVLKFSFTATNVALAIKSAATVVTVAAI